MRNNGGTQEAYAAHHGALDEDNGGDGGCGGEVEAPSDSTSGLLHLAAQASALLSNAKRSSRDECMVLRPSSCLSWRCCSCLDQYFWSVQRRACWMPRARAGHDGSEP